MPSRDNHYVPQWHQGCFFEPGRTTLEYLDLKPDEFRLRDGSTKTGRARWTSPTSRCFFQTDLYSTFFETGVNDEIERKLFGAIDTKGAPAIKAFMGDDVREWHRHFETLFDYLDIQKIRTPKGLDWLRAQYPALSQNELMQEMQGIRMMNGTIWTESVRELVSAEDSDVKFILTDHPVTIYNPAIPPSDARAAYPYDPSIALKGSQTIFPLSRDFCLILTNLERARDHEANPLEKRTFARNYRSSMVRTDAFIRSRKLTGDDVRQTNFILKARARRFIAAGKEEWLYPEARVQSPWRELGTHLRPPKEGMWVFGGEIYAGFDNGDVHYQDEFGRTEKPVEGLKKVPPEHPRGTDPCGCGSERPHKVCCETRPLALRPSWTELSIRERNLALFRACVHILELDKGKTWDEVRLGITDERISDLYGVFATFWPLETDLLHLLPKPDGRPRAIYTGAIHPALIHDFAVASSLYFGEVLIDHPFVHGRTMRPEYSPLESPRSYRQEVLKAVTTFLNLMPLVDAGLVNLVPDPCNFDYHLRDQMMHMARERANGGILPVDVDPRVLKAAKEDGRRSLLLAPPDALARQFAKGVPGLASVSIADMMRSLEQAKLEDALVPLQPDCLEGGEAGGQLTLMRMAPNFEIAMYLAQATGAYIITDSPHRWSEIVGAVERRRTDPRGGLRPLADRISELRFAFPKDERDVFRLSAAGTFNGYPELMGEATKYLSQRAVRGAKPNFESNLASRFGKVHARAQPALAEYQHLTSNARMQVVFPEGGILDNTVNRLLLMSSSEHHLMSVPMAFFVDHQSQ